MGLLEQQNILARLYTDEVFRSEFIERPDFKGAGFGLSSGEADEIAAIVPNELSFFSESLVWKRLRETEKLLPLTSKALGADFETHFKDFSREFYPTSIKKHLEDALAFPKWLRESRLIPYLAIDIAKFEQTRLEFQSRSKRFAACFLKHDLRAYVLNGQTAEPKLRRTLAVWLRFGTKVRFFLI